MRNPRPGGVALPSRLRSDAGIGMTELAVAIVVLGIVLVGLFPLVVDSIRLAAQNAQVAQATRIVSAQLDAARDELASVACPTGVTLEDGDEITLPAPEADTYVATRTVECRPDALADVTVWVALESDPSSPVAQASTQVLTQGTP